MIPMLFLNNFYINLPDFCPANNTATLMLMNIHGKLIEEN